MKECKDCKWNVTGLNLMIWDSGCKRYSSHKPESGCKQYKRKWWLRWKKINPAQGKE